MSNLVTSLFGSAKSIWGSITGSLSDQTDLQNALNSKIDTSERFSPNGVASLDSDGKLRSSESPSTLSPYVLKTDGFSGNFAGIGTGTSVPSEIKSGSLGGLDFSALGGGRWAFFTSNTQGEGSAFFQNGNTSGFTNPGDTNALWYFDEDSPQSPQWYITTTGNIATYSDVNKKKNIEPLNTSNIYDEFKKIEFVSFNWKNDAKIKRLNKKIEDSTDEQEKKHLQCCIDNHNKKDIGIIAQDFEASTNLDHVIEKSYDGFYRANYEGIYKHACTVIQELQKKIEVLEEKMSKIYR